MRFHCNNVCDRFSHDDARAQSCTDRIKRCRQRCGTCTWWFDHYGNGMPRWNNIHVFETFQLLLQTRETLCIDICFTVFIMHGGVQYNVWIQYKQLVSIMNEFKAYLNGLHNIIGHNVFIGYHQGRCEYLDIYILLFITTTVLVNAAELWGCQSRVFRSLTRANSILSGLLNCIHAWNKVIITMGTLVSICTATATKNTGEP